MGIHIPTEDRRQVLKALFENGALYAMKDVKITHKQVKRIDGSDMPNLFVVHTLRRYVSKNLVRETFNWNTHYYFMTEQGLSAIREELGLPETAEPKTFQNNLTPVKAAPRREGGYRRRTHTN